MFFKVTAVLNLCLKAPPGASIRKIPHLWRRLFAVSSSGVSQYVFGMVSKIANVGDAGFPKVTACFRYSSRNMESRFDAKGNIDVQTYRCLDIFHPFAYPYSPKIEKDCYKCIYD